MGIGYVDESKLTAIANSIRAKKGTTDQMTQDQMPEEIQGIGGGGSTEAIFDWKNYKGKSALNACTYLKIKEAPNTPLVNLTEAFARDYSPATEPLQIDGLNNFDVSKVNSMYRCFYGSGSGEMDLSTWTGDNVTDVNEMFVGSACTKIDLKNFRGSKLTNLYSMFYGASKLTDVNISSLVTDNVTKVNDTFKAMFSQTSIVNVKWPSNFLPNTALTEVIFAQTTYSHETIVGLFRALADRTASPAKIGIVDNITATLSDEEKKIATDKGWTIF